jgi:hypothetical protein
MLPALCYPSNFSNDGNDDGSMSDCSSSLDTMVTMALLVDPLQGIWEPLTPWGHMSEPFLTHIKLP